MAVEWYLQAHENGKEQNVYVANVMKIFSEYKITKNNYGVDIKLLDGNVAFYFDVFEKKISGLMVSRPILSDELGKIIYRIMELGNFVLFAVGTNYPIILKSDVENHLQKDMIKSIGKPKIAENELEFLKLLDKIYEKE